MATRIIDLPTLIQALIQPHRPYTPTPTTTPTDMSSLALGNPAYGVQGTSVPNYPGFGYPALQTNDIQQSPALSPMAAAPVSPNVATTQATPVAGTLPANVPFPPVRPPDTVAQPQATMGHYTPTTGIARGPGTWVPNG